MLATPGRGRLFCALGRDPPMTAKRVLGCDSEACLADARPASPTTQKYGVVNEQVYRACLASRGYERQKTTAGPVKHRGYEFDD